MSKVIIGCDPDSKAHGIAVYIDGKLTHLFNANCIDLMKFINDELFAYSDITAHVENVKGSNAVFMPPSRASNKLIAEAKARGRTLGMCQQSQTELERVFEHFNIEVVHHKISKRWKKQKEEFERVTGWKKRSNEDNRSAAYFGLIGCK